MVVRVVDVSALPKISADAHVNEPHDLWYTRLPEDLREAAPHQIQSQEDGGWRLVVNGEVDESGGRLPSNEEPSGREQDDRQREADTSVDVRLAMMRIDGLNGEMVYPTIGLYVY